MALAAKPDFSMAKRSIESVRRAIDFTRVLESGDSLASVSVTATDEAGADVSTDLVASPNPTGTKAVWTLLGWGTLGASYDVLIVATTDQGDVLPRVVRVRIEGL